MYDWGGGGGGGRAGHFAGGRHFPPTPVTHCRQSDPNSVPHTHTHTLHGDLALSSAIVLPARSKPEERVAGRGVFACRVCEKYLHLFFIMSTVLVCADRSDHSQNALNCEYAFCVASRSSSQPKPSE